MHRQTVLESSASVAIRKSFESIDFVYSCLSEQEFGEKASSDFKTKIKEIRELHGTLKRLCSEIEHKSQKMVDKMSAANCSKTTSS